jgi:hypothetical protein
MLKYMVFSLLLLVSTVAYGESNPLKAFDSLFVRGEVNLTAKLSQKNYWVTNASSKERKNLQVMQVKGSTFVQTDPYKKPNPEKRLQVTLYYTQPPKRVTAIQHASVSIDKVSSKSLRVSGSGDAFLKVTKPGRVKDLVVNLNRHSVADMELLKAGSCQLHIGKKSRLFKRCQKVSE